MLIRHIGHAEFYLMTESGYRIVTDPYDESCGYPVEKIAADAVLVSHHHHDHDAVENVTGHPQIIDGAGTYTLAGDVKVTALDAFHDDAQGSKRGKTLLFLIETEGLKVAHLGDLGDSLTAEQSRALKNVDLLMIPVGGFFTIDAKKARDIAESLAAKIILPMHYKTRYNEGWPIEGPEAFTGLYAPEEIRTDGNALRVTREDLNCHPHVILL